MGLLFFPAAFLMGLLLLMAGTARGGEVITGLAPLSPQPTADQMAPGLGVIYHFAKFNEIREIPEWAKWRQGTRGRPIPRLDYHVGTGPVLTQEATDLVGADIDGLIHFSTPGIHTFLVHSNDGVQLEIGGKLIHKDPGVHADRFSDEIRVEVTSAGWYPLSLLYFEKKNTSTLELYWMTPDNPDPDYVPAEAFAHLK